MITSRITESGVLIVQPSGPLTKDDFDTLVEKTDPWIEEHGALQGLLIDAPEFPGWKNFAGLQSHLRFVRNHHQDIARLAVASDSAFLSALPVMARHFIKAEIQRFEAGDTEEAMTWLESPPTEPAPAIRHAWFPKEKLMWLAIDGKITTAEYKELIARMETILAETSPISFFIDLDNLDGVEFGAMFADLKFGLTHLKSFRRMALIGDEKWIHRLAKIPNPFPFKIKAFDEDEESAAWEWLKE
jgi:hypothetical protein